MKAKSKQFENTQELVRTFTKMVSYLSAEKKEFYKSILQIQIEQNQILFK
jgi:hypothetical protein